MRKAVRIVKALPLLVLSPLLMLAAAVLLGLGDIISSFIRCRPASVAPRPATQAVSVVIPNWNGRDLLAKYLPSVVESLRDFPASELIVVDNGSTDGSADFVRATFPSVKVLALDRNLGFGGGSNAGIRAASHEIVVLLNSDMRVERDFVKPLLESFAEPNVFAVSCQIFFADPTRRREESGLTEAWWAGGNLRVRHRIDGRITGVFPCAYPGGGSCAFDRRMFIELGGFDELFAPFYFEDTDLGYQAWKRGWKVLYQPRSVVYHEHRGTIGKRFTEDQIQAVLKKNVVLFTWKNIHDWRMLAGHFFHSYADALVSLFAGDSPERASLYGLWRAFLQLPHAIASRLRAHRLAVIDDGETFRRPLGGYFADRFRKAGETACPACPTRPSVLFVTPYPICPPVHGGGVFMYQTVRELARLTDLHLVILVDYPFEIGPHDELRELSASMEFFVRPPARSKVIASIRPHAVREFFHPDIAWLIHRQIYLYGIDVVQLEYSAMAQYAGAFRRIPCIVFEHDVYFQSVGRAWPRMRGLVKRLQAGVEYLRALRYELRVLPRLDRVQVCTRENREYLESFLPELRGRIDDDLRAGIDTSRYEFRVDHREPDTMLFLGSFRHAPNQDALLWFLHHVFPKVRLARPHARLVVIGSEAPPLHSLPGPCEGIEVAGFVEDVREPLGRYSVFVCPILSGSGIRVKLLEAFASGIPVVSTHVGAEGLAEEDGSVCALADDPQGFADRIVKLLAEPEQARPMVERARQAVVSCRNMATITERLVASYRREIERKRAST